MLVEFLVHKCTLHQCLTVVEGTFHLDGCDVLAERSKLTFLYGAHLSFWIEHIDMDTLYAEESIGHSRPCVAARCHQHVHLVVAPFLTNEILKQACHEACAYILESQCGAVKEFQTIDIVLHLLQDQLKNVLNFLIFYQNQSQKLQSTLFLYQSLFQ